MRRGGAVPSLGGELPALPRIFGGAIPQKVGSLRALHRLPHSAPCPSAARACRPAPCPRPAMAAAAPYLLSGPARPRLPVLPGPGPSSPGEAAPAPLGACCRGRGRALVVGRRLPGWSGLGLGSNAASLLGGNRAWPTRAARPPARDPVSLYIYVFNK